MSLVSAVLLVLIALGGCLPLTFDHEGLIDFERYPSVYVARIIVDGRPSSAYTRYFVQELRDAGGFAEVSEEPSSQASLTLVIRVEVSTKIEVDHDGKAETEYEAEAIFEANDRAGRLVDHGREDDSSTSFEETIEDALDEVAHHYLRPYRI